MAVAAFIVACAALLVGSAAFALAWWFSRPTDDPWFEEQEDS